MNLFDRNPLSRLKNILKPKDIRSMYLIFFILLLSAIFETVGIASIIPFINIISDPNYSINNQYVLLVIDYFDLSLKESKVLIGISILFLFVFINLFNIFSLYKTLYFIAKIDSELPSTILKDYLHKPYSFFVNSSPSSLTKHILDDASSFGATTIYPLIQIISKSIIILFISILLIIVDYKVFISSFFILTVIYILMYKNFRGIAKKGGEERVILNDERFKITRDAFNSLKEVKFYSLENYYVDSFSKSAIGFANVNARVSFLSTIPRYIIETIMFGILFTSILYLIHIESPLIIHLPLIGVFILAAYRAIPMLQNVYSNINIYKLYFPVFKIIEDIFILQEIPCNVSKPLSEKFNIGSEIAFNNITFGYLDDDHFINDLSFKIKTKCMTSIIGSTGSGKTTLIDILLGFYQPNSGNLKVDGIELTNENRKIFNQDIGYVPQTVNLQENSLSMNIALGIEKEYINIEHLNKIIQILDLSDLVKSLPDGFNTNIGDRGVKLSGGQRQRLGIARALYLSPKVLVLDESTNELDSKTESRVLEAIQNEFSSITIIMITHRLSSLKLADNVLLLKNNKMHHIDMSNISDTKDLELIIDTYV